MAGELIQLKVDRDFSLMPWLLPAAIRDDVRALGRFVRLAEGIAVTPMLSRRDRHDRLVALEAMLDDGERQLPPDLAAPADAAVMAAYRDSLARHDFDPGGARTILRTLQRTVAGSRSAAASGGSHGVEPIVLETWDDVLAYCDGVAAPIGRQMLALCGEDLALCGPPADALCIAMRILKELRDCDGAICDGALLCIPATFMRDASITRHHLSAPSARGQTRAVLDRVLDGVDALLVEAGDLPPRISSRRLRTYVRVVLCRARKLAARCRQGDPLQEKVELRRWERQACIGLNIMRALAGS